MTPAAIAAVFVFFAGGVGGGAELPVGEAVAEAGVDAGEAALCIEVVEVVGSEESESADIGELLIT